MTIKTLMISPAPTHPQDAGNRIRIFQLAEQLRAEGCDLHFAYYDHEAGGGDFSGMRRYWGEKVVFLSNGKHNSLSRSRNIFQRGRDRILKKQARVDGSPSNAAGEPLSIDVWNKKKFDNILLNLHSRLHFQMVWIEYVFLSGILSRFDSSIVKVIDTLDVFTDRHKMFSAHRISPEWFYTNRENEKVGLSRSDYVIAIKEKDAEFFRGMGLPNVIPIGHLFPAPPLAEDYSGETDVLFMGSDNAGNLAAWRYFADILLDRIKERLPRISIQVAGRICGRIPDSPDYGKLGMVSDINKIYRSVKVAINPVTFGTGLKIKVIEPLAFGRPVVTTPKGIEGLEDAQDRGVLVGGTPEEFVDHLVSLLKEPSIYSRQRDMGYQYYCRYQAQNKQRLKNLLTEVRNRIYSKETAGD